jgi:hypothetical protein
MSDKVKSVVRAVPKLEVLQAMLERQSATGLVTRMTAEELQELKIAIHLLGSIDYTPVKAQTKGLTCPGCDRQIAAPGGRALQALPLCWRCMALQNLVSWAEHNPNDVSITSLRFHGHHYGCVSSSAIDDPVMTITLHTGPRLVTTALRYQGPVPAAYKAVLPDNCVIVQGNPEGLPLGFTL